MNYFLICFFTLLPALAFPPAPQALEIWLHPEAADKASLYAAVFSPSISFSQGFSMRLPDLAFDFMLPVDIPFSIGAFMETPDPNLKHFGLRSALHLNTGGPNTDLYFMYVFDFGFLRNDLLLQYNDAPVEPRYFDFRAGVRYLFGNYFALCVESGFKLDSVRFGLAVKPF